MRKKYEVKKTCVSVFCDKCGKKFDSQDRKCFLPNLIVYYINFYEDQWGQIEDKMYEENYSFTLGKKIDLCKKCSHEYTKIFMKDLNDFLKKEDKDIIKKIKDENNNILD